MDRVIFDEILFKNKSIMKGKVLNIGSGVRSYHELVEGELINLDKYVNVFDGVEVDIVADAEEHIPLESESIDTVICTFVLEHTWKYDNVINEISRVLRSGGHCIIGMPYQFKTHIHPPVMDYWRFTEHSLERILAENKLAMQNIFAAGGKYLTILEIIKSMKLDSWFSRKLRYIFTKRFTGYAKIMDMKNTHDLSWARNYLIIAKKI